MITLTLSVEPPLGDIFFLGNWGGQDAHQLPPPGRPVGPNAAGRECVSACGNLTHNCLPPGRATKRVAPLALQGLGGTSCRQERKQHAGEGQARRWLPLTSRAGDVFLRAVTSSGVPCEVQGKAAARDLAL